MTLLEMNLPPPCSRICRVLRLCLSAAPVSAAESCCVFSRLVVFLVGRGTQHYHNMQNVFPKDRIYPYKTHRGTNDSVQAKARVVITLKRHYEVEFLLMQRLQILPVESRDFFGKSTGASEAQRAATTQRGSFSRVRDRQRARKRNLCRQG